MFQITFYRIGIRTTLSKPVTAQTMFYATPYSVVVATGVGSAPMAQQTKRQIMTYDIDIAKIDRKFWTAGADRETAKNAGVTPAVPAPTGP